MRVTDYKPFSHQVFDFKLHFNLQADHCVVRSSFTTQKNAAASSDEIFLNGVGMQLKWVKVDGEVLTPDHFQLTEEGLIIRRLLKNQNHIEIENVIFPHTNKSLEGLYESSGIICTQCEAESFRKITYFPDRPDVMTNFEVRIEADQKLYPILLSNGNRIDQGTLPGGRHFAVWKDPSLKPCYLFAMVAGDLALMQDYFTTSSGRKVSLEFYASADKISQCGFAMESLKHAMAWDEEVFELEYDLDQYMVVSIDDFNAGAMENKGLNIFNSKFVLADQNTATDEDFEHIESVIAHEYFHNYSGNRITLRDWFHLSLKEGLTVFRDQEFSADRIGAAIQRIETVNVLKSRQFTEDAGPNRHPVLPFEGKAVDNFFTATIYEKGSEVIRMIQVILGKKRFREILRSYFKKFDGQAITILDFVQHFQDESGYDFSQFKNWYVQSGTPKLKIAKTKTGDELRISLEQDLSQNRNHHMLGTDGQPSPGKPYVIPLVVESNLLSDAVMKSQSKFRRNSDGWAVYMMDQAKEEIRLPWKEDGWVSLMKNFSSPVLVENQDSLTERIEQFRSESDDFNAFELAQSFHSEMMLAKQLPLEQIKAFCQAMKEKLANDQILPGLKARLLSLPSFQSLSTQVTMFDADGLLTRFHDYRRHLATELHFDLLKQLEHSKSQLQSYGAKAIAYSPETAGLRSLNYQILETITFQDAGYVRRVAKQMLEERKSYSDIASALKLLALSTPEFPVSEFLSELKSRQNDSLVQSKIFKLISTAPTTGVFAAIQEMMKQDFYNAENPNHVYGMIRGFFENSPVFHHSTAAEQHYAFMRDQLRRHDQSNPQVAARLTVAFQLNPKLPVKQKSEMMSVLKTMKDEKFSQNLGEKITQALQLS